MGSLFLLAVERLRGGKSGMLFVEDSSKEGS